MKNNDHANKFCDICNKFHQPNKHLREFSNTDEFIKFMKKVITIKR